MYLLDTNILIILNSTRQNFIQIKGIFDGGRSPIYSIFGLNRKISQPGA